MLLRSTVRGVPLTFLLSALLIHNLTLETIQDAAHPYIATRKSTVA